MNILIVTLGTSDIQISNKLENGFEVENLLLKMKGLPELNLKQNRTYTDSYLLASPRNDGKIILDYYEYFKTSLHYPLITPLLQLLQNEGSSFEEVWWVYTDQENEKENFRTNDTVYYKSILRNYFNEQYFNLKHFDYPITKNVKDIDVQYKDFYQKALLLSNRKFEIDKIFLLPQGGIDQINHALTLQLIQIFKERVYIYQNAELSPEPVRLQFTNLFLNDLTKHNVVKHIKDYDFDKAQELILNNLELKCLSEYAALRLNLQHSTIIDSTVSGNYKLNWDNLNPFEIQNIKLRDLVYAFKIQMKQSKFNDALTKLYTIYENIYKITLDNYTQTNLETFRNKKLKEGESNEPWETFINEKVGKGYVDELKGKKIGKIPVSLTNPNSKTYFYMFRFLIRDNRISGSITEEKIKKIDAILGKLRDVRNSINHNMGSVSETEISLVFKTLGTSKEQFYCLLDEFTNCSGFGIYKQIQKEILSYYGEYI
jgi:hypothetical protein